MGTHFLGVVAVIVGAVEIARASPATQANSLESRQNDPSSNPATSNFLRRTGGAVTVIGDRIYYDGGLVSQKDVSDGRLHHQSMLCPKGQIPPTRLTDVD